MIPFFPWLWHRHVNHVEIQIAAARCPIPFEVNVHGEGLAEKQRLVERTCVSIVCGRTSHQVKPVGGPVLNTLASIDDRGPRQIVRVILPVLVDDDRSLIPQQTPWRCEEGRGVECAIITWSQGLAAFQYPRIEPKNL